MALQPCRECARQVSTLAITCPHCGVPDPAQAPAPAPAPAQPAPGLGETKLSTAQSATIIVLVIMAIVAKGFYDRYKPVKEAPVAQANEPTCAKHDLRCRGSNTLGNASVYCRQHIERLARHSLRWTDRMLESKFSQYRWSDPVAGSITYIGDKVEFQNGFGAFTPMVYECDLAADEKTVLDVRVREGRL